VCDDDPGIRTVVCEQLRRHGYDVIEAHSGEEVIALANDQIMRNALSAAILLDHYLPGLSGWETLRRLKSSPATSAIPVVIFSVSSPAERPLLGRAQGGCEAVQREPSAGRAGTRAEEQGGHGEGPATQPAQQPADGMRE